MCRFASAHDAARDGENTKSNQLDDRLSTGALVEEVELKGDRLHYRLVMGTGPMDGWATWPPLSHSTHDCIVKAEAQKPKVSIKLKDKELAVKTDKAPPPPPTAVGPKGEAGTCQDGQGMVGWSCL